MPECLEGFTTRHYINPLYLYLYDSIAEAKLKSEK